MFYGELVGRDWVFFGVFGIYVVFSEEVWIVGWNVKFKVWSVV